MKTILFALSMFFFAVQAKAQNGMGDICPLLVGDSIPQGVVFNEAGEELALDALCADPTVIVVYRGAWCGYCTRHLAELNEVKDEIEALGYNVIGITVDRAEKLAVSNERAKAEIEVYSDSSAAIIDAFGLNWQVSDELYTKYKSAYKLDLEIWSGAQHHQLPVPAIYVVKDGVVQFQYVNPKYSIRLKADALLAVLRHL